MRSRLLGLVGGVALLGCTPDVDDDGYGADVDCNDEGAATFPGAVELCDGVDNDCDGEVDEDDAIDATSWYADTDADGFGDPTDVVTACTQPAGRVADDSDCDDADPNRRPDHGEVCDGLDNDCNGEVDDDASDATTAWPDLDDDSYGDASATPYVGCDVPGDHVTDDSDCDDTNPLVNPAGTEVCDGLDNDCDATTSAAGTATWFGDDKTTEDWTAALTGTEKKPVSVVVSKPGVLNVCDGTWHASLTLSADVDVNGHSDGDPVVFDASGGPFVVKVDTAKTSVGLANLTLRGGIGGDCDPQFDGRWRTGGGLCVVADATVDGSGLLITDNQGGWGAGVYMLAGAVSLTDTEISDNRSSYTAAGASVVGGSLTLTDSMVADNASTTYGGGLIATRYNAARVPGEIDLVRTLVTGNTAESGAGVVIEYLATVTCEGSPSVAAGFENNVATSDGGAAYFWSSGGTFVAVDCDLGDPTAKTDNAPHDFSVDPSTDYGDDATVTCTLAGCK